jgi:hypothetical protein
MAEQRNDIGVTSEYIGDQWVATARWRGPARQRVKVMRAGVDQADAEQQARSEAMAMVARIESGEAVPPSARYDEAPEAIAAIERGKEIAAAEVEEFNRLAADAEAAQREQERLEREQRESEEAEAASGERV